LLVIFTTMVRGGARSCKSGIASTLALPNINDQHFRRQAVLGVTLYV
jgi:hypothetical protein